MDGIQLGTQFNSLHNLSSVLAISMPFFGVPAIHDPIRISDPSQRLRPNGLSGRKSRSQEVIRSVRKCPINYRKWNWVSVGQPLGDESQHVPFHIIFIPICTSMPTTLKSELIE